jgi:hypothetical protein
VSITTLALLSVFGMLVLALWLYLWFTHLRYKISKEAHHYALANRRTSPFANSRLDMMIRGSPQAYGWWGPPQRETRGAADIILG